VAAASAEPAPAVERHPPLEHVWSQVRPRLQQLAAQSRQLAARWRTLPRNIRYGSPAAAAVLVLAVVWWRVASAGRDEKRPNVPIYEPPPTGVAPTPPPASSTATGRPRPTLPRGATSTPRGSTSSGTATPPDSGARRPPAGQSGTAEPAHLFINSSPWGVLFIDGRQLGNLPQAGVVDVPPGTHTIRILRDGFLPYESVIAIEAGETLRLTDIVLQEKPQ
jgi:hypothetical protein